jgi:hypothetical protein
MNTPRLGSNFALFLLFFGLALIEALQTRDWLKALFWAGIGVVFLYADQRRAPAPQ